MNHFYELFREQGYIFALSTTVISSLMQWATDLSTISMLKKSPMLLEIDKHTHIQTDNNAIQIQLMCVFNIIKQLKQNLVQPEAKHIKYLVLDASSPSRVCVIPIENKDYAIVISLNLLEKQINSAEWKTIIAHEIGHILNHDVDDTFLFNQFLAMLSSKIICSTVIFLLKNIFELIYQKPAQIIELMLAIGMITALIHKNLELSQFFIQKEIKADKKSFSITHDNQSLISGLQKLEDYQTQDLQNFILQSCGIPKAPKPLTNSTVNFFLLDTDPHREARQFVKAYVNYYLQIQKMCNGWLVVASHPQNEDRANKLYSYSYK